MARILKAEQPLHLPYKDAPDRYVYPKEVKTRGKWVNNNGHWEWHELAEEERQRIKLERKRIRGLVDEELEMLKTQWLAQNPPGEYQINPYRSLPPKLSDAQRSLAKKGLIKDDWSPYPSFGERLKDENYKTRRPKDTPGRGLHRLVLSNDIWKWKTTLDNGAWSRVKRWFDRMSLGPINPKVSPATVGASRTAINASLISYLIISALVLVPGVLLYRRVRR